MRILLIGLIAGLVGIPIHAQGAPAAAQLQALLKPTAQTDASYLSIEEAATRLRDKELRALVEQLRPLGTEGNAGWVRCAVFAEWGRRSPQAARKWIENPPPGKEPPFRYRAWVVRQRFVSVFRGWAEVDPDSALEAMDTQVHDPFRQERANLEIFRHLATRDGLEASWNRIPEDGARGGAMQGIFRGLEDPQERLQAVLRWLPELDNQNSLQSPLGYRLGPKMREYIRLHSFNVHATSDFITDAAIALAEADPGMAGEWLSAHFSPRSVKPFLWKWGAQHPEDAINELQAGRYDSTDLIIGILSGDPPRAPKLINRIKDDAVRAAALRRVIDEANGEGWRQFYPSPHHHVLRQQDPRNYNALVEAITVGGFAPEMTHELERHLRSEFSRHVRPDGTLRQPPQNDPR